VHVSVACLVISIGLWPVLHSFAAAAAEGKKL